jgi:nucleoporin NUP82
MRVVTFPLVLESESLPTGSEESLAELAAETLTSEKPPADGPPAYVSLLSDPYTPPSTLTGTSGLPSNARLAIPTKGEFELTPDTLRYLASTVERLTNQMHEIQLAYGKAEMRARLQEQEFRRQQEKSRELLDMNDTLHGSRQEKTKQKLSEVQTKQQDLLTRTNRVLRAMMKSASPELSEHETKWFEELKRLQREIKGATRYDQESLSGRSSQVNAKRFFHFINH